MDNGFSNKEVLLEIKTDLKDFRDKYDEDQDRRDDQISKRPTRGEIYSLVLAGSTAIGLILIVTGG